MRSIFYSSRLDSLVLFTLLLTFSLWTVTPTYAFELPFDIGIIEDAQSIAKIEKLVSKIKRASRKGNVDESIKLMLEFRKELEKFGDIKISIDKCIKEADEQFRNEGIHIPKEDWNIYKEMLNNKSKKVRHASNKSTEDDEEVKVELPPRVAIGITCMLCAVFLWMIPHPYCKAAASTLGVYGAEQIYEHYIGKQEDDYNDRHNN